MNNQPKADQSKTGKGLKIIGITIILIAIGAMGWFLVSKQSQNGTDLTQKNVEVENESQQEEKQVTKNEEQQVKNQSQGDDLDDDYYQKLYGFTDQQLHCTIFPREGDSMLTWCKENEKKLEENPDCNFNFCNVGGKDLGNNYKLYKGKLYYWDDGGGQAVPGVELNLDVDRDSFVVLHNDKYCEAKDKNFYYKQGIPFKDSRCTVCRICHK